MSKSVHWTVPFASLKGVQYRVDIYADGACEEPTQLVAGASPFVTDEDDDDDYFKAVRSQTGNLTVVDMDGTLLETLMPKDNVDRPVRLVRVSDSKVMWQGFLSCEAYSQDYTAREQELTMNVNSVLEAAKSVRLDIETLGYEKVRYLIAKALGIMDSIDGITISKIGYPEYSYEILNKYVNSTSFVETTDYQNEDDAVHAAYGLSVYDTLERICKLMGWCVREWGNDIHLCEVVGDGNYAHYEDTFDDFKKEDEYRSGDENEGQGNYTIYAPELATGDVIDVTELQMSEFEWRGTGHEVEYRRPAHDVSVKASVKDYDMDVKSPDCPKGKYNTYESELSGFRCQFRANMNNGVDSEHDFRFHKVRYYSTTGSDNIRRLHLAHTREVLYRNLDAAITNADGTSALTYVRPIINVLQSWGSTQHRALSSSFYYDSSKGEFSTNLNIFSCLVRYAKHNYGYFVDPADLKDAVYIEGVNTSNLGLDYDSYRHFYDIVNKDQRMYGMTSAEPIAMCDGYVKIEAEAVFFTEDRKMAKESDANGNVLVSFDIGGWYYHPREDGTPGAKGYFSQEFCAFKMSFNKGKVNNFVNDDNDKHTGGLYIPVANAVSGRACLSVYHEIGGNYGNIDGSNGNSSLFYAIAISGLKMSPYYDDNKNKNDYSDNAYHKPTGAKSDESVSIDLDLVSDNSNKPSMNIIMDKNDDGVYEQIAEIIYHEHETGAESSKRPESELVRQMVDVYRKSRRKVSVDIERPDAVIPQSVVWDYKDRLYSIAAESRDWRTDVSTVKLFER